MARWAPRIVDAAGVLVGGVALAVLVASACPVGPSPSNRCEEFGEIRNQVCGSTATRTDDATHAFDLPITLCGGVGLRFAGPVVVEGGVLDQAVGNGADLASSTTV